MFDPTSYWVHMNIHNLNILYRLDTFDPVTSSKASKRKPKSKLLKEAWKFDIDI